MLGNAESFMRVYLVVSAKAKPHIISSNSIVRWRGYTLVKVGRNNGGHIGKGKYVF